MTINILQLRYQSMQGKFHYHQTVWTRQKRNVQQAVIQERKAKAVHDSNLPCTKGPYTTNGNALILVTIFFNPTEYGIFILTTFFQLWQRRLWEEERRRKVVGWLRLIGGLRHSNIMSLRAYHHSNHKLLLVYDFLPNGSLHSLLFLAWFVQFFPFLFL